MDYIRGVTRSQVILFPESVEDYITEDNPVRFIDGFVSSLDLAGLGFIRAQPAETGRPAYDPGDLLRLYLYGYLNRVLVADAGAGDESQYRSDVAFEKQRGRRITRWVDEKLLEDMARRVRARP